MTVFDTNNKHSVDRKMFLDNRVSIARYDTLKYKQFDVLTDKQLGFFWRPQEVDLTKDSKDFRDLLPHEQHIFTSNLKRQIVLDSVQGRAPSLAFLPICSLPELEVWIQTWAFNETIHSQSYTHIIRNVYSNPSVVFDDVLNITPIVDCAKDISKYYDNLIKNNVFNDVSGVRGDKEHKRSLWLALNAVNALEGIRFYVSFACSWAFAELKKMEGNAKIIKFIARDENLHLSGTQKMLALLPEEDEDFYKIRLECTQEVVAMFEAVVEQEKAWADYLFKDGTMIGLNSEILKQYVEWIANRRMSGIGLKGPYKTGSNPLPWTQKWIAGGDIQVAPQETQITSYRVGDVTMDVEHDSFKGFEL
jgi:ribonucleoside-diphosphate reductase beta chain